MSDVHDTAGERLAAASAFSSECGNMALYVSEGGGRDTGTGAGSFGDSGGGDHDHGKVESWRVVGMSSSLTLFIPFHVSLYRLSRVRDRSTRLSLSGHHLQLFSQPK